MENGNQDLWEMYDEDWEEEHEYFHGKNISSEYGEGIDIFI